jgi:uridylate kinase
MATYKRVLLKLSGEALAEGGEGIYNHAFLAEVAQTIKRCVEEGVGVAIMVGAGNIWRGRQGVDMDRTVADSMGMLATCINAMMLSETFKAAGLDACVLTSIGMEPFAEQYSARVARKYLDEGKVVVLGGGSGLPFFSTDTGAALRAAEIEADVLLMAKNIDGIYTADPKVDPTAVKLDSLSCTEILSKGLRAIDSTAAALTIDTKVPVLCFGLDKPENIYRAVMGEHIGTKITC